MENKVAPTPELNHFPSDHSRFMYPGYIASGNGLCQIDKGSDISPFICDKVVHTVRHQFIDQSPDFYDEVVRKQVDKGYILKVDFPGVKIEKVNIGIDERREKYYQFGLKYLEETLLEDPDFFDKSPDEILKALVTAHSHVAGFPVPLRNGNVQVNSFNEVYDDNLLETLRKKGGTQDELIILQSLLEKFKNYGGEGLKKMTWDEKKVYEKLYFLPPLHEQVLIRLQAVTKQFKRLASLVKSKQVDPIVAAAWLHFTLSSIHPFDDDNGKWCRALVDTTLLLGGKKPLQIRSDKQYTKALLAEHKKRDPFPEYEILKGENPPLKEALLDYARTAETREFPQDPNFYKWVVVNYQLKQGINPYDKLYAQDLDHYLKTPGPFAKFLKKISGDNS